MTRNVRVRCLNPKIWTVLLIAVAVAAVTVAADDPETKRWNPPEVTLTTLVPWGPQTALQPHSGWALTLHMTAAESRMLGIGKEMYPPIYPGLDALGNGSPGWLLFDDPDGCPSFLPFVFQQNVYEEAVCGGGSLEYPDCHPEPLVPDPCPPAANLNDLEPWVFDETMLEFRPGVAVPDPNPAVEEPRPAVWRYFGGAWEYRGVGPLLGSMDDLIRYGRSELVPGLVVLADHGPGLLIPPDNPFVLPPYELPYPATGPLPTPSAFFDPRVDLKRSNLAGHFNSLGYTMLANVNTWPGWGRTTLTATLIAQRELFTPVVLIDRSVSRPFVDDYGYPCTVGDGAYRLDGGPVTCIPGSTNYIDELVNGIKVTLLVFVVSGEAPDTVEDVTGDGVVDIDDIEALGYQPITRQEIVTFYQYNELSCGVTYDFDGDGFADECVFGARAGGITGVPR
jgi:hypothetical protein